MTIWHPRPLPGLQFVLKPKFSQVCENQKAEGEVGVEEIGVSFLYPEDFALITCFSHVISLLGKTCQGPLSYPKALLILRHGLHFTSSMKSLQHRFFFELIYWPYVSLIHWSWHVAVEYVFLLYLIFSEQVNVEEKIKTLKINRFNWVILGWLLDIFNFFKQAVHF